MGVTFVTDPRLKRTLTLPNGRVDTKHTANPLHLARRLD
jgi:hypothetical protein